MIVDSISDLHGHYPQLEGGDLLIVAGDLTATDTFQDWYVFHEWICTQKYKCKIFIGGNHDNLLAQGKVGYEPEHDSMLILSDTKYLYDSGTEFEGLKIWGSPWTKTFEGMNPHCKAFTCDTEEELAVNFSLIPDDTDILICHSPRWGCHDAVEDYMSGKITNVGSKSLVTWIANHVNTLKLFVCGHIHRGYGVYDIRKLQKELGDPPTTVFVNASHVNERYEPVNKPIRIEL